MVAAAVDVAKELGAPAVAEQLAQVGAVPTVAGLCALSVPAYGAGLWRQPVVYTDL